MENIKVNTTSEELVDAMCQYYRDFLSDSESFDNPQDVMIKEQAESAVAYIINLLPSSCIQ